MNKKLSIAMGIALAGLSGIASAENDMGLEFSANVAMTTDYVFRGYSQTDEEMAIQGGFDATHTSGVYAGVWGSNVDSGTYTDSEMEVDVYIGWGGEVGPVGVDVGYLRYMYPGAASGTDYDTNEYHIGVSGDVSSVSLGLTYNYSDDFYGGGDADYWDFSASVPVGSFTLAAHYGISDFDAGGDYDDWSFGGSTELGGFGFDLTYTDTDIDNDPLGDDRVVFTVSKSL